MRARPKAGLSVFVQCLHSSGLPIGPLTFTEPVSQVNDRPYPCAVTRVHKAGIDRLAGIALREHDWTSLQQELQLTVAENGVAGGLSAQG